MLKTYFPGQDKQQRINVLEQFAQAGLGPLAYHLYRIDAYAESLGYLLALHLVDISHAEHLAIAGRQRVDSLVNHAYYLGLHYGVITFVGRGSAIRVHLAEPYSAALLLEMIDTPVAHRYIYVLTEMQLRLKAYLRRYSLDKNLLHEILAQALVMNYIHCEITQRLIIFPEIFLHILAEATVKSKKYLV